LKTRGQQAAADALLASFPLAGRYAAEAVSLASDQIITPIRHKGSLLCSSLG